MEKVYSVGDLVEALAKRFGDEAKLEFVEPLMFHPHFGMQEIRRFNEKIALILHLSKSSYTFECPFKVDPVKKVQLAYEKNAIVIFIPKTELEAFARDGVVRDYKICVSFDVPVYYPEIDNEKIKDVTIKEKYFTPYLSENEALKQILNDIDEKNQSKGDESIEEEY